MIPPEVIKVIREKKGESLFYSETENVMLTELVFLKQYAHKMSPKAIICSLNTIYNKLKEI